MSIQKEFVLRYRADGHVRFQIPAKVCEPAIAEAITNGLLAIEGVYRVKLFRGSRKLSIHYQESFLDFKSLAKALFDLLADLEKKGVFIPSADKELSTVSKWRAAAKSKMERFRVTRWAKEKYSDAQETVQAAKIITKLGLKKPKGFLKDPEKAVIDFFNDILVLYLIRLHWTEITQKWLLRPLTHRYELMAMFYMFYLLVRSRKKK